MSVGAPHASASRGDPMGQAWLVIMVGAWAVFFTLLVAAPEALDEIWAWVTGLPLAAEIVMWVLLLPWLVGLAVWQSDWSPLARVLVLALVAGGWILASLPRSARTRAKAG
jgi:hypothetical protein